MKIKEKFEQAKKKAKVIATKTANKIIEFVSNHPAIAVGGAFILGAVTTITTEKIMPTNNFDYYDEDMSNNYAGMISESNDKIFFEPAEAEATGSLKEMWEANYKNNWDTIKDVINNINLKPGEMFILENCEGKPVLSHLVDNVGVYPPEE